MICVGVSTFRDHAISRNSCADADNRFIKTCFISHIIESLLHELNFHAPVEIMSHSLLVIHY